MKNVSGYEIGTFGILEGQEISPVCSYPFQFKDQCYL